MFSGRALANQNRTSSGFRGNRERERESGVQRDGDRGGGWVGEGGENEAEGGGGSRGLAAPLQRPCLRCTAGWRATWEGGCWREEVSEEERRGSAPGPETGKGRRRWGYLPRSAAVAARFGANRDGVCKLHCAFGKAVVSG